VNTRFSRRFLLAGAAAASAGAAVPQRTPIRLGGPVFLKSDDPAELAREHRRLGYSAAYCPRVKLEDRARLRAIETAYQAENVAVAEIGVWVNMLDADPAKRAQNLKQVTEGLAIADEVGARCCVNIAGSYNPKFWDGPHPKNMSREFLDATVENCRRIIGDVKPKRTRFTIEMMWSAIPDGPDSYLELIRAVDRPAFGVHMDVCNAIHTPHRYYNSGPFIRECFRKLGRWIASCHAKDLQWVHQMNVRFDEVIPGRGDVDYRAYLSELAALPAGPPLMLEHLKTAGEYAEGADYIRKVASDLNLKFA
jgi:sugar phosphate isomerase/epimerase